MGHMLRIPSMYSTMETSVCDSVVSVVTHISACTSSYLPQMFVLPHAVQVAVT